MIFIIIYIYNTLIKSSPENNFPENLRCDDYNTQTTNDICGSGTCQGCPIVTTACDSGTWDLSIGQCSATLPPDGTMCDSKTTDNFRCCDTQTTKDHVQKL